MSPLGGFGGGGMIPGELCYWCNLECILMRFCPQKYIKKHSLNNDVVAKKILLRSTGQNYMVHFVV